MQTIQTVILVVHIMVALALVGVVLLQRSEGGALGIGGGGGGFLSGRGTANLLTRATAGLAAAFFVTSIVLSILATKNNTARSIFDPAAKSPATSGAADPTAKPGNAPAAGKGGILDKLQQPSGPAVPQTR